jgi:hypothetical protein
MPVAQKTLSGSALPVSLQAGAPVEQDSAPAWQRLAGAHDAFAAQAAQAPAPSQTWFVPQVWPAATGFVAVHTGRPVEQSVSPCTHFPWVGVQAWPATQAPHTPEWQTRPVPHEVPSESVAAVAAQTGWPVPHVRLPTLHGSAAGVQSLPELQAAQVPAGEQTPPLHAVPVG